MRSGDFWLRPAMPPANEFGFGAGLPEEFSLPHF